jgi:hypothetical protein
LIRVTKLFLQYFFILRLNSDCLNSVNDNEDERGDLLQGNIHKRRIGNEKWRDKILNEIFNNDGINSFSQMHKNFGCRKPSITWGRLVGDLTTATTSDSIQHISQPPFDSDKVNRSVN